jgi:hypothetical protein
VSASPSLTTVAPERLLGRWHIVATTLPFWRGKLEPTVTYTPRPDGTWSDELSWRDVRGRARRLRGVDRMLPGGSGRFRWRGAGVLSILSSEWGFVAVAPDATWCATWFARASFGVTPEGMDVYAREPAHVHTADVLSALRARADLPSLDAAWYETAR